LRYCASRVGSSAAEDLVAETFLIAHQRRHRYDPAAGPMSAWLFGIASNLLRRHRRGDYGILFDPDTGRAVGRRDVITQEGVTLVQPTDAPPLDPGVGYQVLWTHAIVDVAGETG
jgi:DNA-directed RNA polymerase specialized sigma24 family protein